MKETNKAGLTVRFGDMAPGERFYYLDKKDEYMRIQGVMSIAKNRFNCVHLSNGKLGFLEPDTAVIKA